MGKHFLINAFGEDKPGIVAKVSKVLYENGFNLEDSSMSRLGGEFTIMLVVYTDKDISVEDVKSMFSSLNDLNIYVKEIKYTEEKPKNTIYKIVVYGADKPGIVYKVADLLAKRGVNIVDMTTEKAKDLYVLITDVEIPEGLDFEKLREEIKALQDEIGVDVSCEKIEVVEL